MLKLTSFLLLGLLVAWPAWGAQDTLSLRITIHDVVAVDEAFVPQEYALHPPYPNPFNPDVRVTLDVPETAYTEVTILNMRGQVVAVLAQEELTAGRYDYTWQGGQSPSGIYFFKVRTSSFEATQKVTLLK